MSASQEIETLLSAYPRAVRQTASAARRWLKQMLPGVSETLDRSAKMLAYGYGPGYSGMLFTLIMSQTGVKLGIFRGAELPDPERLMAGTGKVHRHVQLRSGDDVNLPALNELLGVAVAAWQQRRDLREHPSSGRRSRD